MEFPHEEIISADITKLSQVKEGKEEVMMGSYDKPLPFQGVKHLALFNFLSDQKER